MEELHQSLKAIIGAVPVESKAQYILIIKFKIYAISNYKNLSPKNGDKEIL